MITFSGSGESRGRMTRRRGFTLIELLIVVAIIGIIVAISLVNMFNAIQRAKQKRSMGDMKSLATAIEAYATDQNFYPAAAGFTLTACGPLRPCSTSYSTSMSLSIAVTPSARPVTCTKMSLSLSCSMKPKAFSDENHFTLP